MADTPIHVDDARPDFIQLSDVTKRFGVAAPALDRVSGAIRGGEITGLVGPDGAGKTTLIRLMTGLMVPEEGSLTVLGFDTIRQSRRDPGCHRLHAAAFRSVRGSLGSGEPRSLCRSARAAEGRAACRLRRAADLHGPEALHDASCGQALRRHEAEARACLRAAARNRDCCCSTSRASASIRSRGASCGRWSRI